MTKVKQRQNITKRKMRIREAVFGTAEKPRLSIFRSNKYIYGQLINDVEGKTLVDVSSETKKMHEKGPKVTSALSVGKLLAEKALAKGIKQVVFDRNGYKFHGRVKSFAQGARDGGLTF